MQQHQLQACDLMDRRLEHFLLAVGLPKELGGKLPGFAVCLKHPTVAFELEQLFRWDLDRQPFAEVH